MATNLVAVRSIVYIVNAFEPDAPTRLCLEVAKGAAKTGYTISMLAWSRGGSVEGELDRAGIPHEVLGKSMWRDEAELRARRPAIVHAILAKPSVMGAVAARLARVPRVVATHHGAHEWSEKGSLIREVYPRLFSSVASVVTRHVAVSRASAQELIDIGINESSVSVIPNGVNAGYFYPARSIDAEQLREQLFPNDNSNAIIMVGAMGNLREVKNFGQLIRVAGRVCEQVPAARFVIWGDGQLRGELQQQIENARVEDVFRLPGATSDPRTALRACDVYVQPSRNESFGLSVAEAMACEVPVVVSAAGGLPELVDDAGIIYGLEDHQLAEALVRICSNKALREELAVKGRERVTRHFGLAQMQSAHLKLYTELLQQGAPDA